MINGQEPVFFKNITKKAIPFFVWAGLFRHRQELKSLLQVNIKDDLIKSGGIFEELSVLKPNKLRLLMLVALKCKTDSNTDRGMQNHLFG